jgi:3-(methylthio)propanoyl-CoA dehydrogenase
MMSYAAPIRDMLFVLDKLADIAKIATSPGFKDANPETAQTVLEEAAKFNAEVVTPLNFESDKHPSEWRDREVGAAIDNRTRNCLV